jgi:hypothetical protein
VDDELQRAFALAELAGLSNGDVVTVGDDTFVFSANSSIPVDGENVHSDCRGRGRFVRLIGEQDVSS